MTDRKDDENELSPTLALDVFNQLVKVHIAYEYVILSIGIFFCFFGVKLKRISQISIISFFIYVILDRSYDHILFIVEPLENLSRRILPDSILVNFSDDRCIIGLILVSFIMSSIVIVILYWARIITLGFIFYTSYTMAEPVFILQTASYPSLFSYGFSALCTLTIYYLQEYISLIVTGLIICFTGVYIIFTFCFIRYDKFEMFKEFYVDLTSLNPSSLKSPILYGMVIFTIATFSLQKLCYKL